MNDKLNNNRYLISQKIVTMRGKYHIYDDSNKPLFYCEQDSLFQLKHRFTIYEDESKKIPLLSIRRDAIFQIFPSYTVCDASGNSLARLIKSFSIIKSVWRMVSPGGLAIASIIEDGASLLVSLFMKSGKEYSNYGFYINGTQVGALDRKFVLYKDKYLLDMSQDHQMQIDRRLALASSIILDIGENR